MAFIVGSQYLTCGTLSFYYLVVKVLSLDFLLLFFVFSALLYFWKILTRGKNISNYSLFIYIVNMKIVRKRRLEGLIYTGLSLFLLFNYYYCYDFISGNMIFMILNVVR